MSSSPCSQPTKPPVRFDGGHSTVTLEGDAAHQRMVFTDTGPPFDPTQAPPPPPATDFDMLDIGGRGLLLVRRFATTMAHARADGRNRLELTFG
ncbi:MAG TPA: ATP-binding protein [Roseococcus sp.]|nr:ATP-binding protein [Roseococcus sp.]